MRTNRCLPIVLALVVGACSGPDESAAASGTPKGAEPASNEPLLSEEDAVPSQEEAEKAAEASIDEANADAELQKLEKELAEGGAPGGG